jgi:hypothetical protein
MTDIVEVKAANGHVFTLQPLGTNAICRLEEELGKPFGELMSELGVLGVGQMRLTTVRAFLRRALVGAELTPDAVGDLIDAVGFDGISSAINGLIAPARSDAPAPPPSAGTAGAGSARKRPRRRVPPQQRA